MDAKKELPKRKHPRLKEFDYSANGAYFVTICTQDRRRIFSRVQLKHDLDLESDSAATSLGNDYGQIQLMAYGEIAERQLLLLEERYPFLVVDQYVIMPDHIHAILVLKDDAAGASPRPTITDIVCAYKSLTTKECRKRGETQRIFQTSFYEHVIRDQKDYEEISKYICENPTKWYYEKCVSMTD